MATSKKRGSSSLSVEKPESSPSQTSTRKQKGSDGGLNCFDESGITALISRVSDGVLEKLNAEVEIVIRRHMEIAVREIRAALEDRVVAVEKTCKEIVDSLEFSEAKLRDENEQLKTRVYELEHAIVRQEHEANLVVSGVKEVGDREEDPKSVFLSVCKETLGITDLCPDDVVDAVRLGRKTLGNESAGQARPRPILVKTKRKEIKARILACRGSRLRSTGIFLNEDLSPREQAARRAMVPVFKDFRAAGVRCRLDRSCLVVGDNRFFDPCTCSTQALTFLYPSDKSSSAVHLSWTFPIGVPFEGVRWL